MPYRNIEFRAGEYYHLYNRGNNFQPIFFERENYLYFLRQLREYLVIEAVEIVAYCLMPNHYHLLVHLNVTVVQPEAESRKTVSKYKIFEPYCYWSTG